MSIPFPPPPPPPPPPPRPADPSVTRISLSQSELPPVIAQMVGAQNDQFEVHVLACLLKNPAFAEQVMGVLGIDASPENSQFPTYESWNDFRQDIASALFACFKKYREQLGTNLSALTEELLTALLNQVAMEPCGIIGPGPEVRMTIELYRRVIATNLEESTEIVRLGFIDWLRKRRMVLVMEKYQDRRGSSATAALKDSTSTTKLLISCLSLRNKRLRRLDRRV